MCMSERVLGCSAYPVVAHGCRINTARQVIALTLPLRFHLHLHLVKTASVDAVDLALCNKSITIDRLDNAENGDRLYFAAYDK